MKNNFRILTALLCLLVGNQVFAATVGKALVVLGQAEKIMANGAVSLKVGDEIEEKDIVRTFPGAVVQIGLKDGGFIAVRPDSSVSVEQFILDKENPQREKQLTKVFAGSIQAVTGRIGKRLPSNVTYATQVATMGIRGTVIDLGISPTGQTIARVLVGAAEFATPQGAIPMTKGSSVSANRGQAPRKDAAAGKSLAGESAAVKAQVVAVVGESPMDVVVDTEKQVEAAKTLKKEIQAKLDDAAVTEEAKEVLKDELANVDTALAKVEQALDTVKTQLAVEAVSVAAANATVDAAKDAFNTIQTIESSLVEKSIIPSNYTESYSDPETSDDALGDDTSSTESSSESSEPATTTQAASVEDTSTDEADTSTETASSAINSSAAPATGVTRVTNIANPTATTRRSSGGSSSSTTEEATTEATTTEETTTEETTTEEEVVEEEVVEEEVVTEETTSETTQEAAAEEATDTATEEVATSEETTTETTTETAEPTQTTEASSGEEVVSDDTQEVSTPDVSDSGGSASGSGTVSPTDDLTVSDNGDDSASPFR